jgi:ornithine cyclodeaminase/alanine dehydrogenase
MVLSSEEVRQLFPMDEAIAAMEKVFAASARGEAASAGYLHFDAYRQGGWWSVKPGYLADSGYVAVKLGSGYSANPAQGLPTILATILLADASNGAPLAVMDGVHITSVRTGAAGGVAAKYLARKNSKTVGVIGAGVQGKMQVMALKGLFNIEEVRAYSRDAERLDAYAQEMTAYLGASVRAVGSAEDAVRGADILITATSATTPIVKSAWIEKGTHINAVGADGHGKRELEREVYARAKIFTESNETALKKGLVAKEDIFAELGEVIIARKAGRELPSEITLFDSTGVGIQDAAAAALVYEKAKKLGAGKMVQFI